MAWGKGPPSTIEEFARRLAADDPALTSLAILRFRRLDAADARALAAALARNAALRELSAQQHALPPASFGSIARALARPGCGVRSLSLGTGALGDEGAAAVVRGLLGRDGGEGEDDKTAAAAEAGAATTEATTTINASLRHLDFEGRGLGEKGAAAVAELLRWHRGLEELDLGGNEALGDAGARALSAPPAATATAAAAATTTTTTPTATTAPTPPVSCAPLRRLALHRCGLTHAGVTSLASAPFCATLAELSLAENDGLSGARGGAAVAALLAAAPRLCRLDARATGLGDEGAAAMVASDGFAARFLGAEDADGGSRGGLAVLDLTGAGVGAAGCDALAAALLRCSTAAAAAAAGASSTRRRLALRLGHNRAMTASALATLATALARQATVTADELDVGGAALDAAAVRALAAVPGLRHLSLFSCTGLAGGGDEEGEATTVEALCEALASPSSFASLEHLGLAACGLGAPALGALLESVSAAASSAGEGGEGGDRGKGAEKALRCIELGGNPGVQDDAFEAAVGSARERRPSLDVAWRAGADGGGADNGEGGGGGGGGGGGPPAPLLPPAPPTSS